MINRRKGSIIAVFSTMILAGCTGNNSVPADTSIQEYSVMKADRTITIDVSDHQVFNDTDGDGYGEFEGWGTSLCWWANRVGYSDELTSQAAETFFDKEKGLGLNIGRYNIGGGDNVTDQPLTDDSSDSLHASHIKRSDSIVPGYAKDVTRMPYTQTYLLQ